jgi:hypothetical protein
MDSSQNREKFRTMGLDDPIDGKVTPGRPILIKPSW